MKVINRSVVWSLLGSQFVDRDCLEVEGASGGISLLWEKKVVWKNAVAKGLFSILCKFRCLEGNFEWMFYGVYGPNLDQKQAMLWEELAGIHNCWQLTWCIGGDFNVARFPSERLTRGRTTLAMWDFYDFISD